MAEQTNIQWADATVNFWHGCHKVSDGCKFCYMYRDKARYGQDANTVIRSKPTTFNAALKWKEPKRIFTCSWSDFFIEEADTWRADAWDIIRRTPQHTWMILTKRPERIIDCLPRDWGAYGYPNVWLGVSIESVEELYRWDILESIPARIRFISYEPILGDIGAAFMHHPDWVILGGESGHSFGKWRYRPCELQWINDLAAYYIRRGIPLFVKQLGTGLARELGLADQHGGDISEWPEYLRIREFPYINTSNPYYNEFVQR